MRKLESQNDLMELALFYCSRRENSRKRLGQYLKRKCRETRVQNDQYDVWIEAVLDECERLKLVDDQRYADILVRDFTGRGKGSRYISQKLVEKGIRPDAREFAKDEDEELERAIVLAQKLVVRLANRVRKSTTKPKEAKKGTFRKNSDENFVIKQKLLQKLVAAGYSVSIGRKALEKVSLP